MFVLDEDIHTAGSLQIAGIGRTHALLEKYLDHASIPLLAGDPTQPASWTNSTVGILVAYAAEDHAWEIFQKAIQCAKQQEVMLFPILLTTDSPDSFESLMVVNPLHFASEEELYSYISECVKSIQSFMFQTGLVNIDLKDFSPLFSEPGHYAFGYGEGEALKDKSAVAQIALQRLFSMNIAPHTAKYIVMNISGSEENLSMFEIHEMSMLVSTELGTDNCNLIWGASVDSNLSDRLQVSLWVKL